MQKTSLINILKEVQMFASLDEHELQALAEISHIEKYQKEATLFLKGDISKFLILLIEGIVLQQNIHFKISSTAFEKVLFFYEQNPKLSLDLKQYEIASILGMTPETFSRTVKKLLSEGKLEKNERAYRVNV